MLRTGSGNDSLVGGDFDDHFETGAGNDIIVTGGGNNYVDGGSGNDTVTGGSGQDTLTGGVGADIINAGDGSDLIIVRGNEAQNDTINGGGGIDTIRVDATGGALILSRTALISGVETFDGSGQFVRGTNSADVLDFSQFTTVTGVARIEGRGGKDSIVGSSGRDIIDGGAGDDTLNGGLGNDTMIGGAGNDTYVVNAIGDRVFETATTASSIDAGGIDTVQSSVTFNLDAYAGVRFVENLTLTGTANINGTGNALANRLTGNAGNNKLNGGDGNDTLTGGAGNDRLDGGSANDRMLGGAGNDTYVVDSTGDRVFETTTTGSTIDAGGTDTVLSSVGFNLDASAGVRFVENLTLTGTANINGTGNALANRLTGNAGNNVLNGGLGNDTMIGGAGNDTFIFNTALGVGNIDRITDFNVADDTIRLDDAIFVGLATGTLAASAFAANLTGQAATASDRIIYETDTGRLYYDSDGVGSTARVQFATLSTGLALTNTDFFVF